jgi:thioredoxin-related protein
MINILRILIITIFSISFGQQAISQNQKSTATAKINWVSLEEADRLRRIEPRKIMIDVYTDWCGWCKRMDRTTFAEPSLVNYVNTYYYAVKLDAEQRESITIGGKKYEYNPDMGRRGVHEIAQELLQGKMSYPTIVFLDENMNMIQPLPGFREANEMQPILEYLGENAYKETPWEEWRLARQNGQ